MRPVAALCTAVILCATASAVTAQQIISPHNLLIGNSAGPDDSFGASIATYREDVDPFREWLFIGAPSERSARGLPDGAVYIFLRVGTNYQLVQKLTGMGASLGKDGDRFGAGVVAKKGWLIIASPNHQDMADQFVPPLEERPATDTNPPFWFNGRIHVYGLIGSTWAMAQSLPAHGTRREGQFGARTFSSHIAISDDGATMAVGEPDTYAATSAARQGFSRLHVYRHLTPGNFRWCCTQVIDVAKDDKSTDIMAADSVVALPGGRFAVDVHVRELNAAFSADASSSHGEIWIYQPGGQQFGDILSRIPAQKIIGKTFEAGSCSLVNQSAGALSQAGFAGMAAGGAYFAAALPCANGAAGLRTGRVSIYKVGNSNPPLQLVTSFEGTSAEMMLGSSIAGGQESVAIDRTGCRMLVGSTAQGADVRFFTRTNAEWRLQALLKPGTLPRPSFGQGVAFPHLQNQAIVGKIIGGTGQSRGVALVYQVSRCGTSP